MKELSGRIGGRLDIDAAHCTRQDLIAVSRIRQELGGVVAQLPVRWYESAENAVLLRTYTLLCAVEVYLAAEEAKLGMRTELAEARISQFLDEVCPAVALGQAAEEARVVYAGMQDGILSPVCVLGAAYKPLYDEGYVYAGMSTEVLSAMKRHYETVSSVISPVQNASEGAAFFHSGKNMTVLFTAVEGLFRLYTGMSATAIEPAQSVKTVKYRLLTIADHVGKNLSEMSQTTIRVLCKTKEV